MAPDLHVLETTFDSIAARRDDVVDGFYARLFTEAPALRSLLPEDEEHRRTMVLAALMLLRKSLRRFDAIIPTLRALGARHLEYGVLPEHYAVAGPSLIESLADVAGDAWRPEYTAAWTGMWESLADEMLAGAELQLAA